MLLYAIDCMLISSICSAKPKYDIIVGTDADSCPECGGMVVSDGCEYFCSACGFVCGPEIFPERCVKDSARDKFVKIESGRAYGPPTTARLHDDGLTTTAAGWFGWLQKKYTRSKVAEGLGLVELYCDLLNLPPFARETAALIYRSAKQRKGGLRDNTMLLAGAAAYLACRKHRIIRLPIDFSNAGIDDAVLREAKRIKKLLGINTGLTSAVDYVPVICSRLNLHDVCSEATIIAANAPSGKNPVAVAATAVYIAAKGKVTQKKVAEVTGIADATIRNVLKFLKEKLGL